MPERLIEVFMSFDPHEKIAKFMEDQPIINHWTNKISEDLWEMKILILAENSEKLLDTLESEFSGSEKFSVIIIPVEASLPRQEEEEDKTPGGEKQETGIFKRISREELYHDVNAMISNTGVDLLMMGLSAVVATIGLLRSSPAIIIGAMVIAPMLGPNVAQAFATTLGDFSMALKAIKSNSIRIGIGFLVAFLVGIFFEIKYDIPEISRRMFVNFADMVLAFASGVAAAFSLTSGIATSLIGVMVAVSLLPPLATAGMLLGSGNFSGFTASMLLFFINIVCVNLAATLTFRLQGIGPRAWWEADKAGKAVRVTIIGWFILLGLLALAIFLNRDLW